MYFVLYDRNLRSIGETYILEDWSRTQRSVDFDDLKITGEQIPTYSDPFLVVINDQQGKMQFSGLASTPVIDERNKKTNLYLKDYMTLMNSEIVVDWSQFTDNTVAGYLQFILSRWLEQTDVGLPHITWNLSQLEGIVWDADNLPIPQGTGSHQVYELVSNVMTYYDIYCEPDLSLKQKQLTFCFKRSGRYYVSIRLSDFGVAEIEKSFGEYNRASVYSHKFDKIQIWSLTTDNLVIRTDLPVVQIRVGGELSGYDDAVKLELFDPTQTLQTGDQILWGLDKAEVDWDGSDYSILCKYNSIFSRNRGMEIPIQGVYGSNLLTIYKELVYPAKNKNFIAQDEESLQEEMYNAVMELSKNRYQENIDIDAIQHRSILDLTQVDFSYRVEVYTEDGYYKTLPVGEIETDSKGKHIVKLGYRVQELTQEI